MLQELNEKNFDENIKEGVRLVAFSAPWCGYCQKQKPILQEIAQNNIWIGVVNSDDNPNITQKYDIHVFPSFILFRDGKILGQFSGYRPKFEFMNTLLSYLNK